MRQINLFNSTIVHLTNSSILYELTNLFKPLRNELTYDEARDRYTNENGLDHRDWISEKVVILFLESDRHKGTSRDIREMERQAGEEHVSLSNLTLTTQQDIQPRESVLNVVKIRKVTTPSFA